MPDSSYTFNLENGKYTGIIDYTGGGLTFLRHGERWPAADQITGAKVVTAMAHRIEELEQAIDQVLNGALDARGERAGDGMHDYVKLGRDGEAWKARLQAALEQRQ